MPRKLSIALSGFVFSAAVGLAPSVVSAQQATAQATAPATLQSQSISDGDLQKFISAAKKVSMLTNEYAPKVQAASSDNSKQELINKANQKMEGVVKDEGLSVEKFVAISRAAQQDPKVQKRLQDIQK
jgi:hypothetical protein